MNIAVITPVFNDWDSLSILKSSIYKNLADHNVSIIAINDGSNESPKNQFEDITVINLSRNLGHQKAIAVGIAYIAENIKSDYIFVLDSDGEDDPSAMKALLEKAALEQKVVFAKRGRRYEGAAFKSGYFLYKLLFRLLTGKFISFGNYSCIPGHILLEISSMTEIWYNYPGAIAASKLPYCEVKVDRAKRYFGQSKMNIMGLVLHGLGAIAIQLDKIAVRAIAAASFGTFLSIAGIITVLALKFIAHQATPGWATSAIGGLVLILLQFLAIAALASFFAISQKNQRGIIPSIDWKIFVKSISLSKRGVI